MTDLSFYFQPVFVEGSYDEVQLGAQIQVHQHAFPELKGPGCAILSVPEYRGSSPEQLPSTDFRSINCTLRPTGKNLFTTSVQ
jgi:hypothetical protein